jgi:hypothetical protein
MRLLLRALSIVLAAILAASPAWAGDRTNVPLKNWGGFAVYRDWVYDDLERLVNSGLAGPAVLNTKPLSRTEAARIVARAVQAIRSDTGGATNGRLDLEDVVDRLVEEFREELAALGVRVPGAPEGPQRFFLLKPLDKVQLQGAFSTRRAHLVNSLGAKFQEGFGGRLALQNRAQIGDFLSFYLYPEAQANEEFTSARLIQGYAKLTLFNVELLAGRDSLWWGPGFRGSMLFSNNAGPLDQVRLGTAEPVVLPWLFKYLGPMKLVLFVAQLEDDRDVPHAKVGGIRIDLSPVRFLEIGLARAFQFDGRGRGTRASDFPEILFTQGSDASRSPVNVNNLLSFDATLRIPDAGRYIGIARDLMLYGEIGWDDTAGKDIYDPRRPGGLMGVNLSGLFGFPGLAARFEYALTTSIMFNHSLYTSGFTYRGDPLSHFVGTEGEDLYWRVSNRLTPNLMLGLELERATIGSVAFVGPSGAVAKEERKSIGADLSYKLTRELSLFGAYQFSRRTNRDFVSGDSGDDHLLRLELTHSY